MIWRRRCEGAGCIFFVLWLAALWLWLFWSCAAEWRKESFEFGWLVPPLAVYFFFRRLEASRQAPGRRIESRPEAHFLAGTVVIAAALAIGPLEALRLTPLPWRGTLWALYILVATFTFVSAWWFLPRGSRTCVVFPVFFAALALPWPTGVEQLLTHDLAGSLAEACAEVMRWTGLPAVASGKTVDLGGGTMVGIAEACSGMRSIQSALILALGLGELRALAWSHRILLLAFGLFMALLENFLRLLALSWIGGAGGSPAVEKWHDTAGLVSLAILAGAIFAASRFFPVHLSPIEQDARPTALPAFRSPVSRVFAVAMSLGAAGFLLAHAWYDLWPADQGASQPQIVTRAGNIQSVPVPAAVLAQLKPVSGGYFTGFLPQEGFVQGYHFFWTPSRSNLMQLFHRPDACMPGTGWKLLGQPDELTLQVDGRKLQWWNFRFERDGVRINMIWTVLVAGQTFSYPFDKAGGLRLQGEFFLDMVLRRLSRPSYEVAAILMLPHEEEITSAQAQRAVTLFFSSSRGQALSGT